MASRLFTLLLFLIFSQSVFADYYHSDIAVGPKTPPESEELSVITFSAMRTASFSYCENGPCESSGFMYHKKTRESAEAPILDSIKTCLVQADAPDFNDCFEGLAYTRLRSDEHFELGAADFAISRDLMAIAWVEVKGVLPTLVTYKYSISVDKGLNWEVNNNLASYQINDLSGGSVVQDVDIAFNDAGELAIGIFLDQDRAHNVTVLGRSSNAYLSLIQFDATGHNGKEYPVVFKEFDAPEYETLGNFNIMDIIGGTQDTFHFAYMKNEEYSVYTKQLGKEYFRTIPTLNGVGSTSPQLSPYQGTYGLITVTPIFSTLASRPLTSKTQDLKLSSRTSAAKSKEDLVSKPEDGSSYSDIIPIAMVTHGLVFPTVDGTYFLPDIGAGIYQIASRMYAREEIASSPGTEIQVNKTFMPNKSANMMFYTTGTGQNPETLYQVNETQYWPEYYTDLWTLRCRQELGYDGEVVWEKFCYQYGSVGVVDTILPNVGATGVVIGGRYYDSSVLTTETNDDKLPWYGYDQKVVVADCSLEGECAPPPLLSWDAPDEDSPTTSSWPQGVIEYRANRSAGLDGFPKE